MSQTLTVRVSKELGGWLETTARRRGVSQSRIIRDQLELARANAANQSFMKLAGCIAGPKNLSQRRGFSKS